MTLFFHLQSVENLPTVFGSNNKAQTAAKTMFDLAHRHGNILREGWKNIMESMLQLFRAQLLPKAMVEVSTFLVNSKPSFHCVSVWTLSHSVRAQRGKGCYTLLPPTVQRSNTAFVSSGGGLCGAQRENFSSEGGDAFKSVDLIQQLFYCLQKRRVRLYCDVSRMVF